MPSEHQWWQTDKNDSVATSPELWRPLARAMDGFDLDPAAECEPTPIAEDRYTEEDDGLTSEWYGTVWLNPPFSEKEEWYKRLVNQHRNGDVEAAVAVAAADTSTNWFHNYFCTADKIAFLNGRDWYLAQGDSPSFQTMLGLWNPTKEAIQTLHGIGVVCKPVEDTRHTQETL